MYLYWLVVSTPLKHISQIESFGFNLKNIGQNGNLPQIGVKLKHIPNRQPVIFLHMTVCQV